MTSDSKPTGAATAAPGGIDWGKWPGEHADAGNSGGPFPAGMGFRAMRAKVPATVANDDGAFAVKVDVPVADEKGKPKAFVDDAFFVWADVGVSGANRDKAPRLSAHVTTAYALDKATARVVVAGDCSASGVDEVALIKAGALHVDVLTLGKTSKYGG